MELSIFSRIVSGEIPAHKLYEDEHTLAFLDIHPAVPGHTLVIPKVQVDSLWDLKSEDYHALLAATQKVARRLQAVLGTSRVGARVEGFDVPHAHIHLLPINSAVEFHQYGDPTVQLDPADLAELASRLRL